jgi:hypothetical protein
MKTNIFPFVLCAVLLGACIRQARPSLQVQPVYENSVVVAGQHYSAVPLKAGGEFRYQWRPEREAFIATNRAALR